MLLVIGADQYIGYSILSHLAQYKKLRPLLRATCHNKQRCLGFIYHDIDIQEVDYNHPHQLSVALRGVDQIILVVGNEANRVDNAKHICHAAAQSGVTSIVCVSHVGSVSMSHPSLQEYNLIEQEVINSACQYTIVRYVKKKKTSMQHAWKITLLFIRIDFVQQYFHLWSTYAEKYRQFVLPVSDNTKICPVDITDVCNVIELLCLKNGNHLCKTLDDEHDGQVYLLTGPEAVSGKRINEYLIEATGYQKFKFSQIRPMDLSYYLSGLGKDVWFDARMKREMSQIYHDEYDTFDYRTKAFCNPTGK